MTPAAGASCATRAVERLRAAGGRRPGAGGPLDRRAGQRPHAGRAGRAPSTTGAPSARSASSTRWWRRRAAGEPLQYVLGRWGFRTLDLFVDRRVLIPRPETEVVAGPGHRRAGRARPARPRGRPRHRLGRHRAVARGRALARTSRCGPPTRRPTRWPWPAPTSPASVAGPRSCASSRATGSTALPDELRGRVDVVVSQPALRRGRRPAAAGGRRLGAARRAGRRARPASRRSSAIVARRRRAGCARRRARRRDRRDAGRGRRGAGPRTPGSSTCRRPPRPRRARPRPRRPALTAPRGQRSGASVGPRVPGDPIDEVVAALQRGGVVVLPTDTVYGLAALPDPAATVDGSSRSRAGPPTCPLAVLCADGRPGAGASPIPRRRRRSRRSPQRWWPGPLTLVLPRRPGVELHLGEPAHHGRACACPTTTSCGPSPARVGPIAATSANRHGEPMAATAAAARAALRGRRWPRRRRRAARRALLDRDRRHRVAVDASCATAPSTPRIWPSRRPRTAPGVG